MDWTLALQRNQTILLRSLAWLYSWIGLEVGGSLETLPRIKWRTVLFVLRPSESACRRLVLAVMYVRGVVAPAMRERTAHPAQSGQRASGKKQRQAALPRFKLTDTRKHFDLFPNRPRYARGPGPFISVIGGDDPFHDRAAWHARREQQKRQAEAEQFNAVGLCLRMNALMTALNDLDAQALRMARLLARAKRQRPQVGKFPLRPLRPGLPPGYRRRNQHEVDEVLKETHQLAWMAEEEFPPPQIACA